MLQGVTPGRRRLASLTHSAEKNIHDYFQSEIFSRSDASTQEFLMATALLQGITVQIAEQLTGVTTRRIS